MRTDPKLKTDGYVSFLTGIDSGILPNSIKPNQVAYACNVTFRNGWAASRPGFRLRDLDFNSTEPYEWFRDHRLQGAGIYKGKIVFVAGGRSFLCDVWNDFAVTEITPTLETPLAVAIVSPPIGVSIIIQVADASLIQVGLPVYLMDGYYTVTSTTGTTITMTNVDATPGLNIVVGSPVRYLDPNSSLREYAYVVEADSYCVIQDGQSAAIIYDGATSRRADISKAEVPTGTVMAYGRGRLWVAISDNEFVAGDINNGPTSVIEFTENIYLNGGGSFSVPSDAGPITAMVFISEMDQSYGQGPLQIFTERGVFSVNTPMERDVWQNVTNPIQTQTLIDHGALSHNGTILVNGDIFYRSRDGVRSLIFARRDFGTWGNSPISGEMDTILADDDEILLKSNSAVVFDNRMLFTLWPKKRNGITYHGGIGSLDFRPLAGLGRQAPPIWEGVWTGITPMQLVKGVFDSRERCFAFVLNADGENEFWEVTKSDPFDNGGGRIESYINTRSMIFGSGFEAKRLSGLELWYDDIKGTVDWEVSYRPDQYPCWYTWQSWTECQTSRDCADSGAVCPTPTEYRPGYRTRRTLPQPPTTCETNDSKPTNIAYEFQFRVQWTGKARLKFIMAKAQEVEESPNGNLVTAASTAVSTCRSIACCDPVSDYVSEDATDSGAGSRFDTECQEDADITFSPAVGSIVTFPAYITLTCNYEDAIIYYTTDGSDPDDTSTIYTGPVAVPDSSVHIRAIAYPTNCPEGEIFDGSWTDYADSIFFQAYCNESTDTVGQWDDWAPNGNDDLYWWLEIDASGNIDVTRFEIYQLDSAGQWTTGGAWATDTPVTPPLPWPQTVTFDIYPLMFQEVGIGVVHTDYQATWGTITVGVHQYVLTGEPIYGQSGIFMLIIYLQTGEKIHAFGRYADCADH